MVRATSAYAGPKYDLGTARVGPCGWLLPAPGALEGGITPRPVGGFRPRAIASGTPLGRVDFCMGTTDSHG